MKKEYDMTSGPFMKKLVLFALPVTMTGLLQIVYNTADTVVVGRFAGKEALAAVGSTGSLISLIVNLFVGIAMGAGVLTARHLGAKNNLKVYQDVHTAISLSIISGFIIAAFGISMARILLVKMNAPPDTLPLSVLYVRIYFAGAPGSMLFNFGAAILRSTGDTQRPLKYLAVSGLLNIALNLFTVTVLGLGVAGVGLATIASQYLTAILVTVHLTRTDTAIRLKINKLHLNKPALLEMLRIGLPAGFQNALFSISNVIIQSNVNSFGSAAMAGISAGSNFDSYIYTVTNGFSQAAMTFTSQNIGAKKKENLGKIFRLCFITASVAAVILSCAGFIFRESIVGIFSKDPEVIRLGAERMEQIMPFYTFCSLLDVVNGSIRGFGHSFDVMLISLAGTCGLRLLWVFFVLPLDRTLRMLYWAYPISWFATLAAAFILYMVLLRKYARNDKKELPDI